MISQTVIRDYRPGDETAIVVLFEEVFGQRMTLDQWRWKYKGNGGLASIKLAFAPDDRLVGQAAAMALRGWHQGEPWPFFQVCDVMVHPAARGQLGGANLFTRLAKSLLSGLAERKPGAFAYGFPGRRPFLLGEYARVYDRIDQACSQVRPARKRLHLRLLAKELAWGDGRLDGLWTKLAREQALALIRDGQYLRWRYASHPIHFYDLVGLFLGPLLLGWAVIRKVGGHWRVVDLLIGRSWLRLGLAAIEHLAATGGAEQWEIWLPATWRERVGGPWVETEVVVTNMVWALPMPTEQVRPALYYTMGDLDIF